MKSEIENVLLQMKTNRSFMQTLRNNNIYTFEHPFEGQTLERIGFFSELLHKSMNVNKFQKRVHSALQAAIIDHQEFHFVPSFAINTNVTRHRERLPDGMETYHSTEAFEIECEPKDASALISIIMLAELNINRFGMFVPFSLVREDSELLIQKIADNNHYKTYMTTMHLNGWHSSVLAAKFNETKSVSQVLLEQQDLHVISIERTFTSDIAGQWAIIIRSENRNAVRAFVNEIIIPSTVELDEYKLSLKINDNFKEGLSITQSTKALVVDEAKHIIALRNKTTFLSLSNAKNSYDGYHKFQQHTTSKTRFLDECLEQPAGLNERCNPTTKNAQP